MYYNAKEWALLPNPIKKNLDYFYQGDQFDAECYTHYHRMLWTQLPALCEAIQRRGYAEEAIVETLNGLYGRWAKTLLIRWLRDLHDVQAQELIRQGRGMEIVWPQYSKYLYWIDEACLEGSPLYLVPNLMRFKRESLSLQRVVDTYQSLSAKYSATEATALNKDEDEAQAEEADVDFHDLTPRELAFYTFFHNMRFFLEYKHTFALCRSHTEVAQRIVRPMVQNHIITYRQAMSREFIEALLGMICYELDPRVKEPVKNMREAMRPYLVDLKPAGEE